MFFFKFTFTALITLILYSCNGSGGGGGEGSSSSKTPNNDSTSTTEDSNFFIDIYLTSIDEDVSEVCFDYDENNISETQCDNASGTYSSVDVPAGYTCSISTNEANCLANNGSWFETCKINGITFTPESGSFNDSQNVETCELYGAMVGSCSITTNDTDCTNAGGSWDYYPAKTVTSCSNLDLTDSSVCSAISGRFERRKHIELIYDDLQKDIPEDAILRFIQDGGISYGDYPHSNTKFLNNSTIRLQVSDQNGLNSLKSTYQPSPWSNIESGFADENSELASGTIWYEVNLNLPGIIPKDAEVELNLTYVAK